MPYQLLPETFWIHNKYSRKYCNRANKCILNYHINIPQLILKNTDKYSAKLLLKDMHCMIKSLEQNGFHLMQRRRGSDYAMIVIQCDLYSKINQKQFEIDSFEIEIKYNINTSFTSFLFPKLQFNKSISNFEDNYPTQIVYYNYDSSIDENIEIRWVYDKYKYDNNMTNNIAICTTALFGFPPFISLWMYHHVKLKFIDKIFLYVNYESISSEFKIFLNNVNYNKIEIINWTITNQLPWYSSFYEFQQLAYLHCQYNNMYKYKWLLYLDSDDSLIIFNNIAFHNYIKTQQNNPLIHSIQFPWIGWSYSCIYHILDPFIIKNDNMTFCQLPAKTKSIPQYPPAYGKYIMKPLFVDIPFIHYVQNAINKSTSIYLSRDINDFVYIQHMQFHKMRPNFNAYDQHIKCIKSLNNKKFVLSQNMKILNQSYIKMNQTQKWFDIMFNTNIVYANHSYYC
eukprot:533516_1